MVLKFVIFYLIVLNLLGFFFMGSDKRKAQKEQWRIPERNFFIIALLGGSLGCWLGMQTFRHKTKHHIFTIGIPAITLGQIICALILLGKGFILSQPCLRPR